jgi:hypothetical protein
MNEESRNDYFRRVYDYVTLHTVEKPEMKRNGTIKPTSLCKMIGPEVKIKGTIISGKLTLLCVVSEPEMTRKGTIISGNAHLTLRCQ